MSQGKFGVKIVSFKHGCINEHKNRLPDESESSRME